MTLRLITAPTVLPITLEETKAWLRIEHDEQDAVLELMLRAALAHAERWCSRAFLPQTWEQVLDAFPTNEIGLGLGPVVSVEFVRYDDADAMEQTVDAADYVVDNVSGQGWVVLVTGGAWPTPMATINAVRVRFVVGAEPLTDNLRVAILQTVGHWNEHREAAMPVDLRVIPMGAESIFNLHRAMFV